MSQYPNGHGKLLILHFIGIKQLHSLHCLVKLLNLSQLLQISYLRWYSSLVVKKNLNSFIIKIFIPYRNTLAVACHCL
jgi:hypothetical protein